MKKDLIVLMGGPGAGKGTFAKILRTDHEYDYIETGALLRDMPPDSEIGRTISAGNLVPDNALFGLISDKLADTTHDVLLDGFPRTIGQAKWLTNNYADKFNIHVLYMDVPKEIIIKRLTKRFNEGSKRADDGNPEIVQRRIENFINTTMPAIDWLRNASGIKFSDIDVSGELDDNMKNIMSALN